MKKQRTKLAVALLALACSGACVGAGVAYAAPSHSTGIVAQASTEYATYTLNGLTYVDGDSEYFFLRGVSGDTLDLNNWDEDFTLAEGEGITLNGEAITPLEMKQPDADLLICLESPANEGDILSINGTFVNDTLKAKLVINGQLQWNGSAWVAVASEEPEITYTTYTTSGLQFLTGSATTFNACGVSGDTLGVNSWDHRFTLVEGEGFALNGVAFTPAEMKQPGTDLYIVLGDITVNEGDILSIKGTFVNEDLKVKIVLDGELQWNGSAWQKPYTTYTTSGLQFLTGSATTFNACGVSGDILGVNSWDHRFTLVEGEGFALNGTPFTPAEMKQPGTDLYIVLGDITVNEGDILSIKGTFVNEDLKVKIVLDGELQWNGSAWTAVASEEPEVPEIEYTEYNVDNLIVHMHSRDNHELAVNTSLWLHGTEDPSDKWSYFTLVSGEGFKVNGVAAELGGMQNYGGGIYLKFAGVNVGDVISISGTYVNDDEATKYIIKETKVQFTETGWVAVADEPDVPEIEYTTYTTSGLQFLTGSATTFNACGVSGDILGVNSWDHRFTLVEGEGFALNGVAFTPIEMKQPGTDLYIVLGDITVNEGDILSINGTFASAAAQAKIVLNGQLKWNGSAWETYGEITPVVPGLEECEEYTLGALVFHHMEPNSLKMAHFAPASGDEITLKGDALGDLVWNSPFTFLIGSGAGIKLNNNAITPTVKYPQYMFVELANNAKYGDVITIGGTFYNLELKVKYVVEESSFIWNGREWQANDGSELPPEPDALAFEVNKLAAHSHSTANVINAYPIAGDTLYVSSWDYAFLFIEGTGAGFLINGEVHYGWEMKQPGNDLYIDLRYTAQAGDILTIDGEFISYAADATIVFKNCQLYYTGNAWEAYVEYDYTEVGAMIVNRDDPNTRAQSISLLAANGAVLPINDWLQAFAFREGSGVGAVYQAVNGDVLYPTDIKAPGGQWYIGFLYNGEWRYAEEGDILTIGGTFVCPALNAAYVIAESTFIYTGGTWINEIDGIKSEAVAELDAYATNFAEADYYEAEWKELASILSEGKDNINWATTKDVVAAALEAAKTAMDDVATKAESDAILATLPAEAKAELAAYKNEADYRAAEWAKIQEIIATANAEIDAGTSVTAIKKAVAKAKTAIDALYTAAQWDAAEAVVANAKAELASYKSEADYRAAEWEKIQEIIANANVEIDSYIFQDALIAETVAAAKASMDKIFTAEDANAADAVIAAAMAELAGYKSEENYYENEWTEIQIIIANAATKMDKAYGDSDAIAAIVVETKAAIDEVKTKDIVDAENFAAAKEAAINEVVAYYGALDHSRYTDEAEIVITGYMEMVMEELEAATTYEALEAAVEQFKANVADVEMLPPAEEPEENEGGSKKKGGCGSLVAGGLSAGVAMAAAAVVATLRKKKED